MLLGPRRIALEGNLHSSLQHHRSLLLRCSSDGVPWDHTALPWVVLCRSQQRSSHTCQGRLGSLRTADLEPSPCTAFLLSSCCITPRLHLVVLRQNSTRSVLSIEAWSGADLQYDSPESIVCLGRQRQEKGGQL